jgi:ABC-type dipeptide/oligopeptide/nickel transport system ATPase component
MSTALVIDGLSIVDAQGTSLVADLSFSIEQGSVLGLVGESGSGKTLTALAVMGLLPTEVHVCGGSIKVDGIDVTTCGPKKLQAMRGSGMAMVFQEPMTALDPVMRIDRQLIEAQADENHSDIRQWVQTSLEQVGITDPQRVARSFPHELSGGMRQRVLIAMGLAATPRLILADEPTTALDAVNRREVLDLLAARAVGGAAVVLITHDLGSVRRWADYIVVMRNGRCCESGPAEQVLLSPQDPYTKALLACVPSISHTGPLPEVPL